MPRLPWVRLVLGAMLVVLGLVLARRTVVRCDRETCAYGDERLVGGDVREVGVREIERITVERTMNRDGERRSQAIFLLRSGARLPATPLDDHDKTALVTSFAAVQAGEQPSFVEWYAGLAGYASPVVGALGAMLLAFAGRAMRKARALTSSK